MSRPLLERAFQSTYGIEMKDVFANLTLALGTYRWTVKSIIPGMTRVAWEVKQGDLRKEIPGITRRKFLYNISRASYEKEWGKEYEKPGCGARLIAFFVRILPATGPFSALRIRTPTPAVEALFMSSFNTTVGRYKDLLATVNRGGLALPNENFDAGKVTLAGEYAGSDEAYEKLVGKLADRKFAGTPPELRADILKYYQHAAKETPKLAEELEQLKAAPAQ